MKIGIIGLGRAGFNMARYFKLEGHDVFGYDFKLSDTVKSVAKDSEIQLTSFEHVLASVDWLFLAVPDDVIASTLAAIDDYKNIRFLGHFSGASDCTVLKAAPPHIKRCALHPMGAFNTPVDALDKFNAIHFGVEGDADVFELLKAMLPKAAQRMHLIHSKDKPLYHLSAVWASNLIMNVLDQAEKGYKSVAIPQDDAREIVYALAQTAIDNYKEHGLQDGLTGPIARGDVGTVQKHLQAVDGEDKVLYLSAVKTLLSRYTANLTSKQIEAFKKLIGENE